MYSHVIDVTKSMIETSLIISIPNTILVTFVKNNTLHMVEHN